MAKILSLETATDVCSVVLSEGSKVLAQRETQGDKSHSAKLIGFIHEVMEECHLSYSELDAVTVSKGPGSYTGLRIGVSTAKGICYAGKLPLIAIPSLQSLAAIALKKIEDNESKSFLLCPMIDARRMEVYTALYDKDLNEVDKIQAKIIDGDSFKKHLEKSSIYFFGNGSEKTMNSIQHPNAVFLPDIHLSARGMTLLAENAFRNKDFEDVAYFEPYYLKDFIASIPKKKIF